MHPGLHLVSLTDDHRHKQCLADARFRGEIAVSGHHPGALLVKIQVVAGLTFRWQNHQTFPPKVPVEASLWKAVQRCKAANWIVSTLPTRPLCRFVAPGI